MDRSFLTKHVYGACLSALKLVFSPHGFYGFTYDVRVIPNTQNMRLWDRRTNSDSFDFYAENCRNPVSIPGFA